MKKLSKETIAILLTAPESGPVYAKVKDLETITLDKEVELKEGTFGKYLSITHKDIGGTKPASIRAEKDAELGDTFRLELWIAERRLEATATRKEIAKGTQKVFAIPA